MLRNGYASKINIIQSLASRKAAIYPVRQAHYSFDTKAWPDSVRHSTQCSHAF